MSEKILKSRIVHKHDVAANWALATNFSPLKGEIIVYDPDENNEQPRVKVGDGETNVNDLPFVTDGLVSYDTVQELTDEQRAQARKNIAEHQLDWYELSVPPLTITVADGSVIYTSNDSSFDMEAAINKSSVAYASWNSIAAMANYATLIIESSSDNSFAKNAKRIVQDYDSLCSSGIASETMYVCVKKAYTEEPSCIFTVQSKSGTISGVTYTHTIYFDKGKRTGTLYYNLDTNEYYHNLTMPYVSDDTLTKSRWAADAKAVGDALALKADQTALDEVSALVGDTSVSDQIGAAIDAISSEHFVVTVSSTTTDDKTTYTSDKTFAEIQEAYNNGCVLECNYKDVFYQLNSTYAGMSFIFVNSGTNGHNLITFFKNGTIRYTEVNYRNLITTLENNLTGQIAGKSDASHTHDDIYYTEIEIDTKLTEVKSYADTAIANLVNSAPETLDTLGELATAFEENEEVVGALNNAITTKASQDDLNALSALVGDKAVSTQIEEAIKPMTIAEIDAICTMDDVTALVIAEYLAEATDNEGNTLTDNENNTYVF